MDFNLLIPIIATLLFSAFFSGIEIAFISANKLHIELQKNKGFRTGKILSTFIKNPSRFIGTTLLGNTISLVIYGVYMTKFLDPAIRSMLPDVVYNEATVLVVQTIFSTIVVLLTAEFLPKSIFLINPNRMLSFFAFPMNLIYKFPIGPIASATVAFSKLVITKIFRIHFAEDRPVFGLTDLNNYIKNTVTADVDTTVEVDHKIFSNALEFKTIRIRECMIPRTELTAVDIEDDINDLLQAFIESGHTKILVYKESIDDVIGFCHSSEMFKKPKTIQDILTPIIIVPETMLANELMIQFIAERKSLALVVDEFGGTSGIVSIEDIIEEIFGEIQDEHDEDVLVEEKISETSYRLSARHEIDALNDKYEWTLPTGDYETLGGLILSVTEDLPSINETISIPNYEFTILSMDDIRINIVKITVKSDSKDRNI